MTTNAPKKIPDVLLVPPPPPPPPPPAKDWKRPVIIIKCKGCKNV
ncbi:MAG TPA: hypothetical protein PLI22_00585 [Caldisericia bacterium]|jgi:hypothetical protein|nr:hypothetical protein [Caldisericia bacterium]